MLYGTFWALAGIRPAIGKENFLVVNLQIRSCSCTCRNWPVVTGEVQNIPQFLFRINKYDCRSQELEMPVGTEGGRCSAENRMDRRKLLTRSILIQFASQRTAGLEITKYPDEGRQYPLRSTWALGYIVWDVIQCGPAEDKWLHGLIGCCKNSLDRFATGYLRCVQKEQLARGVLVLE